MSLGATNGLISCGLRVATAPKWYDERLLVGEITLCDGAEKCCDPEGFGFDSKDGDVYIDGSCFGGSGRARAAGLAAVQLIRSKTGEGLRWKVLSESLGRDEPQEASYAEQKALVRAVQMARGGPVNVVADCAAVVANARKGYPEACHHSVLAGGLMKQIDWSKLLRVRKTKAHRSRAEAVASGDLEDFAGNDFCDMAAKEAVRRYPRQVEEEEERLNGVVGWPTVWQTDEDRPEAGYCGAQVALVGAVPQLAVRDVREDGQRREWCGIAGENKRAVQWNAVTQRFG